MVIRPESKGLRRINEGPGKKRKDRSTRRLSFGPGCASILMLVPGLNYAAKLNFPTAAV